MDPTEASQLISDRDEQDRIERSHRLVELTSLRLIARQEGFSGQAAQWLFEDVKATWLYGCFTATVLTAHAFCSLQLAGRIRFLPDDPTLPDEAESLEHLARIAMTAGVLDVDLQARLLELHDRYRFYTAAGLHEHDVGLDRHLVEAAAAVGEHPLLLDARHALATAVRLIHRT